MSNIMTQITTHLSDQQVYEVRLVRDKGYTLQAGPQLTLGVLMNCLSLTPHGID